MDAPVLAILGGALLLASAALAIFGIAYLRQRFPARARALVPFTFALSLPTNILLIIIVLFGILSHSPALYLSRDEAQALDWIKTETRELGIFGYYRMLLSQNV